MQLRPVKIFILLLLIVCCGNTLLAQASFTATITPAVIGKDEIAELRLIVRNVNRLNFTPPDFLNRFTVINNPVIESGRDAMGGPYATISYLLKPRQKGRFTIAGMKAMADGKKMSSNAVNIQVTDARTNEYDEAAAQNGFSDYILKDGESTAAKEKRNIFVVATASKKSCYVGEPVLVTYKLYTRLKSESRPLKNPSMNGFSVIDLVPFFNMKYVKEKLDGREYYVSTLRKAQVYPSQTGVFEIEPLSAENTLCFIKENYLKQHGLSEDFYRDKDTTDIPAEAMVIEKAVIESGPLQITVTDLPAAKKPAGFNGAVGHFAIGTALDSDSIDTDGAGRLRLIIQGEGNLPLVNVPEIKWPAGIEALEPGVRENINRLTVPVSGNKIFDFTFTAAKEGSYTLPAIDFSFFDLPTGKYQTVSTQPVVIKVKKGKGKKEVVSAATSLTRESFFETLFTKRWLIILPVALLILAGLFIWLRADEKLQRQIVIDKKQAADIAQQQEEEMAALIENPLEQTEAVLPGADARLFYHTLNKELHLFLAKKLNLAPETINKKMIADGLDKAGVPVNVNVGIQELLQEISLQLYTPFADETRQQDCYERAVAAVHAFDKPG